LAPVTRTVRGVVLCVMTSTLRAGSRSEEGRPAPGSGAPSLASPPRPSIGTMASTPLGDFLRGRRARVTPREAGVPVVGVRRVPGLRREEVAMLAGMSVDYYVRLEQGRERHPSAQVLDALSQVLQLDDDARLHL